jgi:hypothetical protein
VCLTGRVHPTKLHNRRQENIAVSKAYHAQPELLGGALFVEWNAGGVKGWHSLDDLLSDAKFLEGVTASLGNYSLQQDPSKIPGCGTRLGRQDYLDRFNRSSIGQAMIAMDLLRLLSNRPNRYPSKWGKLTPNQMAIVLTEYNKGPTKSSAANARPGPYGKIFLDHYKDIHAVLK